MIDEAAPQELLAFMLGAITAVAVMLIARRESVAERRRLALYRRSDEGDEECGDSTGRCSA